MAAIYRNINGSYAQLSADVAIGPAANDGGLDGFSWGVEREMKLGAGTTNHTFTITVTNAGVSYAQDPANIDDLVTNAVISEASPDVFDFKAMEKSEVAGGATRQRERQR